MSSFARVFDPLDLEIIDRVVEAVWVRIEAQSSLRDGRTDDELKEMLLKQVMICAASGKVDFDALYDKVAASMSEALGGKSTEATPRPRHTPAS
jgi:hypothetical protein